MEFQGKVAIVTGGTGFLGTAVCAVLAESGIEVVAVHHRAVSPDWTQGSSELSTHKVRLAKADVAADGEMERVVANVLRELGRVDILVNTVGGFVSGSVEETSLEAFQGALDLNLTSAFLACKAVLPAMRAQGRGKIVNVASRASLAGKKGRFLYSASKAGVVRLTETLADEQADSNIQVNCVLLSTLDTPANRTMMPKAKFDRWVTPVQAARVIRWLCSEEADPITGASIPIFGRG